MATDRVQELLERCDPSEWKICNTTELQEGGEGEMMVPYLMDCRRKQKLMCQQLCMLDDMMKLLAGVESPEQLLKAHCPQNPGSEARGRWKALKKEYQEGLQEVERLAGILQDRMAQLHSKHQRLEALVLALDQKKEDFKEKERIRKKRNQKVEKQIGLQLEDSLQMAHNALRLCEGQMSQLRAETDGLLACIGDWTLLRDKLQGCVEATQGMMQYRLLSVGPSELCVELRPRSCRPSARQLLPLCLSVTTHPNDCFHLQVFQGTAGLLEECVEGPLHQCNAALLEVMQRYISQGEMLAEIQFLQSRFAIDWLPGERLLVFLKSASVVCDLHVGEGYPSRGRATLLSVRKDGNLLDIARLQPPVQSPVLTDWLEFLSSNPAV